MILVTGFEAFGTQSINPTGDAVRALRSRDALAGRAHFLMLPVTYAGAPEVLFARARRERVRGCLMFGLASRDTTPRVERAAYNLADASLADNAGSLRQGRALREGAPARVDSRGPIDAVRAALCAVGADARDSDDPGRFVCNATYFSALTASEPWGPCAVFVHVPPTKQLGGSLSPERLERWVLAAAEAYEAALREEYDQMRNG